MDRRRQEREERIIAEKAAFYARPDLDTEPDYWEGRMIPAENKPLTLMQQWILDQAKPVWFDLLEQGSAVHNGRRFHLDMSVATETSGGNLSWERA